MEKSTRTKAVCMIAFLYFILSGTFPLRAQSDAPLEDPIKKAVLWTFHTGAAVYNAALVSDNVVYIGSQDKNFYALNAKTGEELWHYETDEQIRTTATLDKDVVCFASGNQLYGLNRSGELLWKTPLAPGAAQNDYDAWDFINSSPRIVDGVAYVGSEQGMVFGVNSQTGEQVLQIQTSHLEAGIHTKPLVHNNLIFFGDWQGFFYAYDRTNGELKWMYDTNPERLWNGTPSIETEPTIINNTVLFAGRSCILYALDLETGTKVWAYEDPNDMWLLGGIALDDTMMCLGSSNQRLLHRLNALTGELKWRSYLEDGRIFGIPLVYGDYIYVGSGFDLPRSGSFWMVDKETGTPVNRLNLNYQVQSSPIIVDGVIYFGCENGNIYAIDEAAMHNTPRPNIEFDKDDIDIGDLQQNETDFNISFPVYNTGEYPDSVSLSWSGSRRIAFRIPNSAINLEPQEYFLDVNDSLTVSISIDVSQLNLGENYFDIEVVSKYSFPIAKQVRHFVYNVIAPSALSNRQKQLPDQFTLSQNYPNPFNPATSIDFQIPFDSDVNLKVYNLRGEELVTLVNEVKKKGNYNVMWQADQFNSGMYVYRLLAGQFCETRKMMLVK